jgi:hypothetical protein
MGFYVSGGGEGSIAAVKPQPESTESKDKIKRKLTSTTAGSK